MAKKPSLSRRLGISLLCCCVAIPALAQPAGLRMPKGEEGISLSNISSGLRVKYLPQSEASLIQPGLNPLVPNALAAPVKISYNSLWADWQPFNNGVRGLAGVRWRLATQNAVSGQEFGSQSQTAPFLGLGWSGEPMQNSRWKLSAELGTYFSRSDVCNGERSCLTPRPTGLNPEVGSSGIRLNPYLSVGATFSFDN